MTLVLLVAALLALLGEVAHRQDILHRPHGMGHVPVGRTDVVRLAVGVVLVAAAVVASVWRQV